MPTDTTGATGGGSEHLGSNLDPWNRADFQAQYAANRGTTVEDLRSSGMDERRLRRATRRAKRKHKKGRAREERERAEENIASNVDLAETLYNRDLTSQADPELIQMQRNVLDQLGQISREGWTQTDRQALDMAQRQAAQFEQSQRQAALGAAARRGDASGGNALMGALAAQQGGANRASDYATELGVQGRQRALSALGQQGQMAGQMQGQQDSFMQWATGQKSSDAGMLMNARLGQSQYQLGRAEELKPMSVGEGINAGIAGIQSLGSTIGSIYGMGGGSSAAPVASGGAKSLQRPEEQQPQSGASSYVTARRRQTTGLGGLA